MTLVAALRVLLKSPLVGIKFNICSFGSGYTFLWRGTHLCDEYSLAEALKSWSMSRTRKRRKSSATAAAPSSAWRAFAPSVTCGASMFGAATDGEVSNYVHDLSQDLAIDVAVNYDEESTIKMKDGNDDNDQLQKFIALQTFAGF